MMMWIGLSNNQTIEIELFGTLEAEENSQFALDMNSFAAFSPAKSNKEQAINFRSRRA